MLALLKSSCYLYLRVILITCNLVIYLSLYGALKTVDNQPYNLRAKRVKDLKDDGTAIEEREI